MSSPGSDAAGDDSDAAVASRVARLVRFVRVAPGGRSSSGTILLIVALLFVPWSVQVFSGGEATFLFAWGLLNTNPPSVTTLFEFLYVYTRGLPEYILAWPLSVLCYVGALASAVSGWLIGREDPRITAGLLIVAAVAQVQLAWGFAVQPTRTAWPVGSVALVAVAWWCYWPALRASIGPDA